VERPGKGPWLEPGKGQPEKEDRTFKTDGRNKLIRRKGKWKRTQKGKRTTGASPLLIGVLPLEKGSGATQLSIMLANYLTAKEREKGVVVFQRKETVAELGQLMESREKQHLTIKGMELLAYEESQMSRIMNQGYQFILWCFEKPEGEQWEEFLRCHRHLVVCNLTEWHEERLEGFVRENKGMGGFPQWRFLSSFGPKERFRELQRRTGIRIDRIPWCEDPFSIKREWFSFLETLV
jgi:hypothetical protein